VIAPDQSVGGILHIEVEERLVRAIHLNDAEFDILEYIQIRFA
jgi:hypothetical protein